MTEQTEEHRQMIQSGQFFKDGMAWYIQQFESPISERPFLIVITALSTLITGCCVLSFFLLLPMTTVHTMVVKVERAFDMVPQVKNLTSRPDENPNTAVLRWSIADFVRAREAYNIRKQDVYHKRVYAQAEEQVYNTYVDLYRGDLSPTNIYERHTERKVEIRFVSFKGGNEARVEYLVVEDSKGKDPVKSEWIADISFRFTEIEVDQITGEITPMTFKVTGYKSKQIG